MTRDGQTFVDLTELTRRWPVDRKTILSAIHRGEIPSTRIGQRLMVPLAWVLERERDGTTGACPYCGAPLQAQRPGARYDCDTDGA